MRIEYIRQFIKEKAVQFGAKTESFSLRDNTEISFNTNTPGAYLGLVEFEEVTSGPYHDFSLVLFPSDNEAKQIIVSLGIGPPGFKNDYNLATFPGLRRYFSKLIDNKGYCKIDFSDIESSLPKKFIDSIYSDFLKRSIQKYKEVLPVCQIVDEPESEAGKKIITAFVAGYAKLRDWPSNKDHRNAISEALEPFLKTEAIDEAL